MAFNFGAMAGGLAKGYSQGIEDQAKREEAERKKKDRERIEKEQADDDAIKAELKGVSPQSLAASRSTGAGQGAGPATQPVGQGQGAMLPSTAQAVPQAMAVNPATLGVSGKALASPAGGQPLSKAVSQGVMVQRPQEASPTLSDYLDSAMQSMAIKQKYGKDTTQDQLALKMTMDKLDKEGVTNALALAHGGDFQGMLHELNNNGQHVGWSLQGEPVRREFEVAGQKIPGYTVSVVNKNGDVRTINTAQDMFAKLAVDKQLDAITAAGKAKADAEYNTGRLGLERDKVANDLTLGKEKNAIDRERVNAVKKGVGGKGKWVQDATGEWQFLATDETAQGKMPDLTDRQKLVVKDLQDRRNALLDAQSSANTEDEGQWYQPKINAINKQIDELLAPPASQAKTPAVGGVAGGGKAWQMPGTAGDGKAKVDLGQFLKSPAPAVAPQQGATAGNEKAAAVASAPAPAATTKSVNPATKGVMRQEQKEKAAEAHNKYSARRQAEAGVKQIDDTISSLKTQDDFNAKFAELFGQEALKSASPADVRRKVRFALASKKPKL